MLYTPRVLAKISQFDRSIPLPFHLIIWFQASVQHRIVFFVWGIFLFTTPSSCFPLHRLAFFSIVAYSARGDNVTTAPNSHPPTPTHTPRFTAPHVSSEPSTQSNGHIIRFSAHRFLGHPHTTLPALHCVTHSFSYPIYPSHNRATLLSPT